jgi:hypothetical protein
VATLDAAGPGRRFVDEHVDPHLAFPFPVDHSTGRWEVVIKFVPLTPNGQPFCPCGG